MATYIGMNAWLYVQMAEANQHYSMQNYFSAVPNIDAVVVNYEAVVINTEAAVSNGLPAILNILLRTFPKFRNFGKVRMTQFK